MNQYAELFYGVILGFGLANALYIFIDFFRKKKEDRR